MMIMLYIVQSLLRVMVCETLPVQQAIACENIFEFLNLFTNSRNRSRVSTNGQQICQVLRLLQ